MPNTVTYTSPEICKDMLENTPIIILFKAREAFQKSAKKGDRLSFELYVSLTDFIGRKNLNELAYVALASAVKCFEINAPIFYSQS